MEHYGHGDRMVEDQLGQNNRRDYSSPVQVGSDTTWKLYALVYAHVMFMQLKLMEHYSWGRNDQVDN